MSFASFLASAAQYLSKTAGGAPAATSPLGDFGTAAGAGVRVFEELIARKIDLTDDVTLANAVQQILVDLGIEPGIVLALSKILETCGPVVASAYASGIVAGGYRPLEDGVAGARGHI